MGGDKNGRYYARSRRVNGRVVCEYVDGGMGGQLGARLDDLERQEREAERAADRAKREKVNALDAQLAELNERADLLVHAALAAAGFTQHKRGEWRKRRG